MGRYKVNLKVVNINCNEPSRNNKYKFEQEK